MCTLPSTVYMPLTLPSSSCQVVFFSHVWTRPHLPHPDDDQGTKVSAVLLQHKHGVRQRVRQAFRLRHCLAASRRQTLHSLQPCNDTSLSTLRRVLRYCAVPRVGHAYAPGVLVVLVLCVVTDGCRCLMSIVTTCIKY